MANCVECKQDDHMPGETLCADCYWDKDAEIKKNLRMNPVWVFQRAYSAAILIYGVSHEKAIELAGLAIQNM